MMTGFGGAALLMATLGIFGVVRTPCGSAR